MAIHLNHLKIIIIIVRNNLIQGEVLLHAYKGLQS